MKKVILTALAAALLSSSAAQALVCKDGALPICIEIQGVVVCLCPFWAEGNSNSQFPGNFNKGLIKEDLVNPGRQTELIRPNR